MSYGWEGSLTRLVPLDEDKHFDNVVRWVNDPRITEWLLIGDFPLSRLAERDWFSARMRGDERDVVFAVETLEGEHIGMSGIHRIDFRHGVATTGSYIGDTSRWGRGYGTDQARVRARYCFEVLGLRMLISEYFVGNDRSARMQAAAGYVEVGRIPKRWWKRGRYVDEVITVLTRERWEEIGGGR